MIPTRYLIVIVALLVSTLAVGCAHKQAINQANDYAEQEQWRKAHAQCQRALELNPDSEDAQRCAADTRPRATSAALEDARAELNARRYAAALEHIDYVDSIHDEPQADANAMRESVRDAVRTRLEQYLDAGQMERAYDFAGVARDLYPNATFVENAYAECRRHFREEASQAEEKAEYERALEALDIIGEYEPGRSETIDGEKRRIRDLWAQSLETKARELESEGKRAGAATNYARAFELSSREKARVQLGRLADELRGETLFGVQWRLDGPEDWTRSVEQSLEPYFEQESGLIRDTDSPELRLEFDLDNSDCSDEATGTTQESTEYVAGTRRVSNPDFERTRRDLERTRDDLYEAKQRQSELENEYRQADQQARNFRSSEYSPVVARLDDARRDERDLEAQVESAEQLVEQGEAQIRQLERDENVSEETITAQRMTVQTLRKDLYQKENRLDDAERERRRLENELRGATSKLQRLERDRDRLYDELSDEKSEVQRLDADASRLDSKLRSTPETLEEEVIETFEYEVTDWTRTCRAEVTLDVVVADTDRSYATALEASASTSDSSHQAYPEYGVSADPLEFPNDDVELWGQVDETLAENAHGIITGHARKFWNRRTAEAVAAMDDRPHFAADLLMSVYLSAPDSLDTGEVKALEEHLAEHYFASPLETIAER